MKKLWSSQENKEQKPTIKSLKHRILFFGFCEVPS